MFSTSKTPSITRGNTFSGSKVRSYSIIQSTNHQQHTACRRVDNLLRDHRLPLAREYFDLLFRLVISYRPCGSSRVPPRLGGSSPLARRNSLVNAFSPTRPPSSTRNLTFARLSGPSRTGGTGFGRGSVLRSVSHWRA